MKSNYLFMFAALLAIGACKENKPYSITFTSPEAGSLVKSGNPIKAELDLGGNAADSVLYLIDSTVVEKKNDQSSANLSTKGLTLGNHLITAKVYSEGTVEDAGSNIIITASRAPREYSYKTVNIFPHDTSSYIEGLEYHDGVFYESDGEYGGSSLRKVDLKTGKVLQKTDLDPKYFGEGITLVGDKIIQLTYKEGVGFVYDKNTMKKLAEFPYQAGREGWGLYFDGKRILNTDGSNTIYFLNKDTYQKEGSLEVYDDKGPVDMLNELEVIDGKIYANVYTKDYILIIDPGTGAVEGKINLASLVPEQYRGETDLVLNGIAWDAAGKRLFVTGKKWDKLFEIKIYPAEQAQ